MAERFYSMHPEDNSFYNVQQQQQHLGTMAGQLSNIANAPVSDYNYLQHSAAAPAYYTTATGGGSTMNVDMNNNRSIASLRQFGGVGDTQNYNRMLLNSSNALAMKYGGNANYANQFSSNISDSHHLGAIGTSASGCQYAHANGSSSCYNRNRYTPYSHNRACAAAAVAAATGQPIINHQQSHQNHNNMAVTTAAAAFNYQQFALIYQTCNGQPASSALPPTSSALQSISCNAAATPAAVISSTQQQLNTLNNNTNNKSLTDFPYGVVSSTSLPVSAATASIATSIANTSLGSSDLVPSSFAQMPTSTPYNSAASTVYATVTDPSDAVTLQITNLDYSLDEASLRNFLLNQLKPITPVVSLVFEGSSYAKVTVPDLYFAKQVVSNLHRKKIGHKRMLVSYTRDSSLTEINTLRCQVAGLLKDVPYYTLPMYKFRELFQSRFKTSISVLDLYKMQDICTINSDNNEDKFISLQPDLVNSLESSPLMEGLQHSVPYCTIHFKREQHKGWAEQDIEPLPNVCMTITEIQQIIYPLLKRHTGDIPVASLVHCIEGELNIQIITNETGVNLEHLVCCVQGIQIQVNNFGIKILGWLEFNKDSVGSLVSNGLLHSNSGNSSNGNVSERSLTSGCGGGNNGYSKTTISDPLYQISREVIELVKMSPKSTMKFNRFIPAYHNHFGKQCRVADYGYTKLIELFEALSSVVQIMGDGENRQITLTHRTQIRRFTSDLLRVLRAHGNNSVLLSQLPTIFEQTQNRSFDVTDYGVCDIVDILDGLVNSNIVVIAKVQNGKDILISIPKRKQTLSEIEKTCIFAGEMVELFRNALQYTILFQKFVRSYHYHFAYQCRLSDYGFLKLADLMEAIHGVVEMEQTNDESKKLALSPQVARRVFAEQCEALIRNITGTSKTSMKLDEVLKMHKKKYGYQIQPQTLGVEHINEAIMLLPYVELINKEDSFWITCHNDDAPFRLQCYRASKLLLAHESTSALTISSNKQSDSKPNLETIASSSVTLQDFINEFNAKYKPHITQQSVSAMKHTIEIYNENKEADDDTDVNKIFVRNTSFIKFLISIVRLLEQQSTMLLVDIKTSLNCNIKTTFEYGFPNLYTLLSAYPDLFVVSMGITQERSEVSLTTNCELRCSAATQKSHKHLYGSLKLPYGKQKSNRSPRVPLGDHNNNNIHTNSRHQSQQQQTQAPPAKSRAISNDSSYNVNYSSANYKALPNVIVGVHHYQQTQNNQTLGLSKSQPQYVTSTTRPGTLQLQHQQPQPQHYNVGSQLSLHSTASQHSSILNTSASNSNLSQNSSVSNKENSFNNSSLQLFNNSFNSSTTSNELNNSFGNMSHMAFTQTANNAAKLWDRRQAHFYQQQPQQHYHSQPQHQQQPLLPMVSATSVSSLLPPHISAASLPLVGNVGPSTTESAGLFELVNNMQMCPMYEPPKPDTPPSDSMPFWIDPIWANNNALQQPKNNSLNIRLPEMKALNVLPMLLSPYTLSKTENMKQQVFNFDSHDRKIA